MPDARQRDRNGSSGSRADSLDAYRRKRDFARSPEPQGEAGADSDQAFGFVIQKHAARRLHYDLRLLIGGTYKSWAVAKGPSLDPGDKRLAIRVEDHPAEYGNFEGVIPPGEYGGGTVMLWDRGSWSFVPSGGKRGATETPAAALEKGRLKLELDGEKLKGGWALVRMGGKRGEEGRNWLLIKEKDAAARPGEAEDFLAAHDRSVASVRSMDEIAADRDRVWQPGEGEVTGDPAVADPAAQGAGDDRAAASPDPAAIPGAREAAMPGFIAPQLAQAGDKPPRGGDWLHEIKVDGYRLQIHIDNRKGKVRVFTRNGKDWSDRFPDLARAAAALPADHAVIDGEITVEEAGGVPSFAALQQALAGERPDAPTFYAFDLLHLDLYDLRNAALADRKAALRALLEAAGQPGPFRFSDEFAADGERVFAHACRFALEGIVSKKRDAPYRSGRQRTWRKTKCVARQEFVIAGYSPSTTGARRIGSLLLAYHDEAGRLVYAGRVGTGFSERESAGLREMLDARRRSDSPLDHSPVPLPKGLVWTEPELVCEAEYRTWTEDGLVRQAAYKGLREDKPAAEVGLEGTGPPPADVSSGRASSAGSGTTSAGAGPGATLSHPDRLLYPEAGLTKLGLAEYWQTVAEAALPEIAGRPLSLVRCPSGVGGECFYQKHIMAGLAAAVRRLPIREAEGRQDYMAIDDLAGLLALVQMGTLEVHSWGARADDIERPDRLVFDLDPGDGVAWQAVVEAALEVRTRLADLGLESLCKTTGGKGLHVVAPIRRRHGWGAVKAFCRALAEAMAADAPRRFVATAAKSGRKGRIYVDYLRNARGATAICPYSPRAKANAPVAAPVGWDEVPHLHAADQYGVANMARRIAGPAGNPWAAIGEIRQSLTVKALRGLGLDPDKPE